MKGKVVEYQELTEDCRCTGWKTLCQSAEVGRRGFAGRSRCKVLVRLGVTGAAKKGKQNNGLLLRSKSRGLDLASPELCTHCVGIQNSIKLVKKI